MGAQQQSVLSVIHDPIPQSIVLMLIHDFFEALAGEQCPCRLDNSWMRLFKTKNRGKAYDEQR